MKYKNDLLALRKQAAGEADWAQTISVFETRFFAMRVPVGLLNDHLQAFWDVNKVKENSVDANKQTEMLLILDELIKKVEAL